MEKMTKMLKKGLDPNFQDHETGGEFNVSMVISYPLKIHSLIAFIIKSCYTV